MKKTLLTIALAVVVCFAVVSSTFAWLMDKTNPVTNTFTFGNIDITLTESKGDGTDTAKSFKMIPGAIIDKDPVVTVEAGSEACWLFIKIEETNNTFGNPAEKFITYALAAGWTPLKIDEQVVEGVYYREVDYNKDADQKFSVLLDNVVTANSKITKDAVKGITNAPQLVLTAYAVQHEGIGTAIEAWAIALNEGMPLPTT